MALLENGETHVGDVPLFLGVELLLVGEDHCMEDINHLGDVRHANAISVTNETPLPHQNCAKPKKKIL
jgi:hypothetical protein